MKQILFLLLIAGFPVPAHATVNVVTTLPDLADFARRIGGDRVNVEHIVRGDQNPHFVEVKPSYMIKLKSADLLFMIGLDLEMWVQQIVDGSRNNRLRVVELSGGIERLDVPANLNASHGDVHRFGNPHYWLDPRNVKTMVSSMSKALGDASPADREYFAANAGTYIRELNGHIVRWESQLKPYIGSKVITFHRSWSYFSRWLGLDVVGQVEPNPGIQPSPLHTAALIRQIRETGIRCIIVEPFYDRSAPDQLARATGAQVVTLSTSVGGVDQATDYIAMMEYNVSTLAAVLGKR